MLKTILSGNIGQDAEVRSFENGRSVITFSVAHSEKWKDAQGVQQEKTVWIRCNMWRKSDQLTIAQYLKKGVKVLVEGKPSANAYTNQAGELVGNIELTVDGLEFMSSAPVENQTTSPAPAPAPVQNTQPNVSTAPSADDDLPF